jgi:serine/threonine-protein kinase
MGHLGRYRLEGEIGRGGMGRVLRAHDPDLGRELALKVLHDSGRDSPDVRHRFLEEAQVGGQLQHPGVVPVYEVGSDQGNGLYFAMKLVRGRDLSVLLRERKTTAYELPRFLQIFEQVCQALAYAHARGVIHRDLKPSNVMVGAFGEVQVMDWGLAKVLSEASTEGDRVRTLRSDLNAADSRAGAVVGTPAYMAPEQARGETDHLDERADVFGLGAILCEILTGRPPFVGKLVTDILDRAARGDMAETFARLDACGADAELKGIARTCLAAEAGQRPGDAGAVAAQVAAYRAGVAERLRRAELERAAAEAREAAARARAAAERRARRLTVGLAATVVLLLSVGGGGGWWLRQQHLRQQAEQARHEAEVREQRLERQAEQARQEAERVRRESALVRAVEDDLNRLARAREERKWAEAWKILERIEGRLEEGGDDELRQRVRRVRDDLTRLRRDQEMVAKLEEARLQGAAAGKDGFDWEGSRKQFAAAFAWYGLDVQGGSVEDVATRIRGSAIREELVIGLDQWKVAALEPDEERLMIVANRADGNAWRRQVREAVLRKDYRRVVELAKAVNVAELPPSSVVFLAYALRRAKEPEQALALLREGRQRAPADFWLNLELGYALDTAEPPQTAEAVRYYTAAQALRPDSAVVLHDLGLALHDLKRLPEAEAALLEAIRLKPDYSQAHNSLGLVLCDRQQLPEAEAAYREAIRLKPDFPEAHFNLGLLLHECKRLPEAEAAYRKAIRLKPEAPEAHNNLGNVLLDRQQLPQAEVAYREAIRLQPDFAAAHLNLGLVLRRQGVLIGKSGPADVELIEFVRMCGLKRRHADAVRHFENAFRTDASLADDLGTSYRYDAACSALAAVGQGKDAGNPTDPERVRLRRQALDWLRADLAAWAKRLDGGKPADRPLVLARMRHWQQDDDLAAVRDADALAKLPEVERADWQRFWQDVEALRR